MLLPCLLCTSTTAFTATRRPGRGPAAIGRRCVASLDRVEVQESRRWVEEFVIGLNMCPWAKPAQPRTRFVYSDAGIDTLYAALQAEIDHLIDGTDDTETTLVVCPNAGDYSVFQSFLAASESLMTMQVRRTSRHTPVWTEAWGTHPSCELSSPRRLVVHASAQAARDA